MMEYCRYLVLELNSYMERFKTIPAYFMVFYLILQLLRFRYYSIKPIEKLSRRHFINFFEISVVPGLTLYELKSEIFLETQKHGNTLK